MRWTLDLTVGRGGAGGERAQRGGRKRQPPITRCALHNNNNNNILGADLSGTSVIKKIKKYILYIFIYDGGGGHIRPHVRPGLRY